MNANAQQWVAALRSGEYLPGIGRLRNRLDCYCPLGVLCQLYYLATGKLKPELCAGFYWYGNRLGSLPDAVRDWAGLETVLGYFDDGGIVALNDGENKSFLEIADIIESEPPGLFVDTD